MSLFKIGKSPRPLGSLFRRDRVESELAHEVRFHLENEIAKNVKAGMTPEEARYAALRSFGGVDQVKDNVVRCEV
jgi:hypothetical protein